MFFFIKPFLLPFLLPWNWLNFWTSWCIMNVNAKIISKGRSVSEEGKAAVQKRESGR
jgi:hypothetical protein